MENNSTHLYFKSKKVSLLLLAATALTCSRILFVFFNDPEGPNLFVVISLALVMYALSVTAYLFGPSLIRGTTRISAAIGIQLLLIVILYFSMK